MLQSLKRRRTGLARNARLRLRARAFPPGAVTFHLSIWSKRGASESECAKGERVMEDLGLDRLYVIHGNALEMSTGTVVVFGPAGIGKSTASNHLVQERAARLIEDGVVLVGVREGRWLVVESGTLDVLHRTSRISKRLRRIFGLDRSIYWQAGGHRRRLMQRLYRWLVDLPSYWLAVASAGRKPAFTPRLLPLTRIVGVCHPSSPSTWYRLDGVDGLRPVTQPAEETSGAVELDIVSSLGSAAEVRQRICRVLVNQGAG